MDAEDFQRYLKERYENQINWYDMKSVWNQRMYQSFQWAVIVLSAITPILVAIEKTRWYAVVISTLVAIRIYTLNAFIVELILLGIQKLWEVK